MSDNLFPLDCIMLVDDDADENFINRRLIMRENLAHKVLDFVNPAEALAALEQPDMHPVDLIILDVNMPEMTGFEFMTRHHDLPPDRRANSVIIMLTTSLNPRDLDKARKFGDIGYHNKPLRPSMIRDSLRQARAQQRDATGRTEKESI